MDTKEINVMDLVFVVLNKWWVVAATAFVFAIASLLATVYGTTPKYTAKGTLYITTDTIQQEIANYSDVMYARALVENYAEILTSNTFFKSVSAESGLDYNFKQIAGMVRVSAKSEAEILTISCVNANPEHAAIIVETVLNNAQSEVARVTTGGKVNIIDHPEVPSSPSSPNKRKNVTFAFLIGAILSAGILILIEIMDNRVKDPVKLREDFDIPVLAELPIFALPERK